MKKEVIIFLSLILLMYFPFIKYKDYIEIRNSNKLKEEELNYLKLELEDLYKININKKSINSINYEFVEDNDFFNRVYELCYEEGLVLINISNIVEKSRNDEYILNYVEFKLNGTLEQLGKFLKKIYEDKIYIDNSRTNINLNYNEYIISLGYIRKI